MITVDTACVVGIAGVVGAVIVKVIDAIVAKYKTDKSIAGSMQHQLNEDAAALRQELRNELVSLRDKITVLEDKVKTLEAEKNSQMKEIIELREQNSLLKLELERVKGGANNNG